MEKKIIVKKIKHQLVRLFLRILGHSKKDRNDFIKNNQAR